MGELLDTPAGMVISEVLRVLGGIVGLLGLKGLMVGASTLALFFIAVLIVIQIIVTLMSIIKVIHRYFFDLHKILYRFVNFVKFSLVTTKMSPVHLGLIILNLSLIHLYSKVVRSFYCSTISLIISLFLYISFNSSKKEL